MRQVVVVWFLLAGLVLTPACLGKVASRPPVQGPFLASGPCLPCQGSQAWLWGLAGGVALGLALGLGLRWWRVSRARRAGAGGLVLGNLESLQGALALVEQVFTGCQRSMKVVDFDDWVARRKKKKQGKRDEPPEL
ncbi:MAG: hypothetical protein KMY53_03785 [Desulfarculus sp.]|nr:hypothetical protein [Pseudomonadota bacterium]MBV1716299.1 hypothetical protein [Desulfarculus sp.]MBU4574201.1 hypothetical protein [Pseudomonadota bacterium]MBU4599355.1 hypothetical protein [Pseudomonadota bacterium]MBV1737261.1 hypothetical protein [Desulfarculus sp.]